MLSLEITPPKLNRFTYNASKVAEAIATKLRDVYSDRPPKVRAYLIRSLGFLPLRADEEEACQKAAVEELERQFKTGEAQFGEGDGAITIEGGEINWRALLEPLRGR